MVDSRSVSKATVKPVARISSSSVARLELINKISVFRGKKLMLNMVQGNQCNIDVTQPMYMQRNEISQQGIIYIVSIYICVYGSNSTRVNSSTWD